MRKILREQLHVMREVFSIQSKILRYQLFAGRIPNHLNLQSGFTMVELLIVFSLTTILTTMAFVSMRDYTTRQSLIQTSQNITSTLKSARSRALTQVKPEGCNQLSGYSVRFACELERCSTYSMVAVCMPQEIVVNKAVTIPQEITLTPGINALTFETVSGNVTEVSSESTLVLGTEDKPPVTIRIFNDGRVESGNE